MPAHNFSPPKGKIVPVRIDSKALRGNLLGDPAERAAAVYLPGGYEESGEEYPLFVDLAGFTGSGLKHLSWTAFGESVPQRLDRLAAEGKMGPVVAVFPDCFTSLGGNQYVNSAATGNWENFLIDEMLPAVESRFRVRRGREHRAVFGKSSGGYGAIVHGMRHADVWNAVACHSGDMDFDLVYRPDFPKVLNALARHGRSIEKYLAHLEEKPKAAGDDILVLMILAMAATYDPDPAAFKGIRLPVDLETCALDKERWARWLSHDPVRLVREPECGENLRRLAGLFIDCGWNDQYQIHYGTRAFVAELRARGVPHRYEEFDDDHTAVDYRMDVSLPYLYGAVTGEA
ncbi:MAG: alpha/beta hydrolase-fold protein [Candidatus Eisenbacteria bacterium]